jgi:hypothetical protein
MIPFFRKIRKKLADDNKFLKYSRYAIGEIALVVIGILIALSINNWNEDRNKKKIEKQYLIRLKSEFQLIKKNVLRDIQFHETQIRSANFVLSLLNQDTIFKDLEILHFSLLHAGYLWNGSKIDFVWSELINTGNQALISNIDLKNSIPKFHQDYQKLLINEKEWSTYNLEFRNKTRNCIHAELRLSISEEMGYSSYGDKIKSELMSQKELIESLNSTGEFRGLISDIIIVRRVGFTLLNLILSDVNEIISEIENEIN